MKGGDQMRRAIGAVVLGAVLAAGAPSLAGAQARGYVKLGGGVGMPMGHFGDHYDMGWMAQVAGGIGSGMIGGRVNGTYGQNGVKDGEGNLKIMGAMGDLVLTPNMGDGGVAPYVLGGAGFQSAKNGASDTNFAWNVGAGVNLKLGGLGVYLEARYLSISTEGESSNMLPITAGVRIGGN
jgi:hypothetical protein